MTMPPSTEPWTLACWGSTNWGISTADSLTHRQLGKVSGLKGLVTLWGQGSGLCSEDCRCAVDQGLGGLVQLEVTTTYACPWARVSRCHFELDQAAKSLIHRTSAIFGAQPRPLTPESYQALEPRDLPELPVRQRIGRRDAPVGAAPARQRPRLGAGRHGHALGRPGGGAGRQSPQPAPGGDRGVRRDGVPGPDPGRSVGTVQGAADTGGPQ